MSEAKPGLSSIDRTPSLREMADRESLRELCEQLGSILQVGVSLYDIEGNALVPPPAVPAYCAMRRSRHGETDRCDGTKANVAVPLDGGEARAQRGCFTGFKYHALNIRSGLDPVGVAVVGPYRDLDSPGSSDQPEGITGDQRAELEPLRSRVRGLGGQEVERINRFVADTIELFLFSSLKSYLASKVHLASVNESFRELQSKNRELRASYEKLKQLDLLKSNFLATVSHELRTPLTSIIGYGEMVLDGIGGKIGPKPRKHVDLIVQKGEQLLQLINSILDLSKIESGRTELNVERIKLKEVVEDALDSVRPQSKRKDLKLSSSVPNDVPELLADRYKLRQILVNLLANAVKFTPPRGKVKIASKRLGTGPNARVSISVSDSGVGIPADQQARVFERFYQVDNSSTRQYGGTGLGLPIVRSFVEMHGGTIRVESETGKGATMIFELPLVPPTRSGAAATPDSKIQIQEK